MRVFVSLYYNLQGRRWRCAVLTAVLTAVQHSGTDSSTTCRYWQQYWQQYSTQVLTAVQHAGTDSSTDSSTACRYWQQYSMQVLTAVQHASTDNVQHASTDSSTACRCWQCLAYTKVKLLSLSTSKDNATGKVFFLPDKETNQQTNTNKLPNFTNPTTSRTDCMPSYTPKWGK